MLVKLLPGLRRFVLGQADRHELHAELLEVFQREPFGAEALLEVLLGLVHGALAVELRQQEVLVLLEAIIAQADRVLDDVEGLALVPLRLDRQIGTHAQLDLFAAFRFAGG